MELKEKISDILSRALAGYCDDYKYTDKFGKFIRWGLVEKDIHKAIDCYLTSIDLPRMIEWTEKLWGTAQAGNRDLFDKGLLNLLNEYASHPTIEDACEKLKKENMRLRKMLWLNHGCPRDVLYGDDGEMQCNVIGNAVDFKRDTIEEIENHLTKPCVKFQSANLDTKKG